MTIQKAITEFLRWKSIYLPESSCRNYRIGLDHLKNWNDRDIRYFNVYDLEKFYFSLKQKNYKGRTIAHAVRVMKMMWKYYNSKMEMKLSYEDIKCPRYIPSEIQFCTHEEYKKMNAVLDPQNFEDLKHKLALNLLWDTGMRVGEMISMNIGMLDSTKPMATIVTEKARQYGLVMWSKETHTLLLRYLGIRICLNQKPELFCTTYRGRNSRTLTRTVERWFEKLSTRAEIRHVSPHMLRHGRAHYILDNGGTIYDVNKVLRHINLESTLRNYAVINEKEFANIAKRFLN